jgi:hypothetical protein
VLERKDRKRGVGGEECGAATSGEKRERARRFGVGRRLGGRRRGREGVPVEGAVGQWRGEGARVGIPRAEREGDHQKARRLLTATRHTPPTATTEGKKREKEKKHADSNTDPSIIPLVSEDDTDPSPHLGIITRGPELQRKGLA